MKILIHAISTDMGGAKRHLDNMVGKLAALKGTEPVVVLNENYEAPWDPESVTVERFPVRYKSGWRRIWFDNVVIPRLVRRHGADLLLSFANFGPFKSPVPHILFETNALYFCPDIEDIFSAKAKALRTLRRALIKGAGRGADLIVVPSRSLQQQLTRALGLDERRIEVVPHAAQIPPAASRPPEGKGEEEGVTFVCTSHLTPHKRVETLVEALDLLQKEPPRRPFRVLCTFDRKDSPAYYDRLMRSIETKGLAETIRFIGRVPQERMGELYETADCMIHTTACESFGFSLLEAKVHRLPTICSDIAVNREIAKKAALYFRTGDAADLAGKIRLFVDERPDGFDFEDELLHWTWERYAHRLEELFTKVRHG